MNQPTNQPTTDPTDPEEFRVEIERTRAELGDTVEALVEKVDVPAKVRRQAGQARAAVADAGHKVSEAVPEPVHSALHRASSAAAPVLAPIADRVRPYRKQLVIALVGAAAVAILVRRRRRS